MISKTWSRKSIATAVAVAVLSVYSMVALAGPSAKASGELSVTGQVTVNGEKMISGGTIFTDSTISTAAQSSASVSISKIGRVELAPNSNLRLSFAENSIVAMLETGSAQVSTLKGTTVNLTTKDGTVVVDGSQATSFTVSASRGRTSWRRCQELLNSRLVEASSKLQQVRVQLPERRIHRATTMTMV